MLFEMLINGKMHPLWRGLSHDDAMGENVLKMLLPVFKYNYI